MAGTLWAQVVPNNIWFSSDEGATFFNEVDLSATGYPNTNKWMNGVYSPQNIEKIYTIIDSLGVYTYTKGTTWSDGTWALEDDDGSENGAYNSKASNRWIFSVWCSADDSIVVRAGVGPWNSPRIRTRVGAAGALWAEEYVGSTSPLEQIRHVHGSTDGSAIFAVATQYGGSFGQLKSILLKRASDGTWSEVVSLGNITADSEAEWNEIQVVSDSEIHIMGSELISTGPNVFRDKMWLWNGEVLVETLVGPTDSQDWRGFEVLPDGSDGWLVHEYNLENQIYRWNSGTKLWGLHTFDHGYDFDVRSTVIRDVTIKDGSKAWTLFSYACASFWETEWEPNQGGVDGLGPAITPVPDEIPGSWIFGTDPPEYTDPRPGPWLHFEYLSYFASNPDLPAESVKGNTFKGIFIVAYDTIRLDFTEVILSVGEAQQPANYLVESLGSNPTPLIEYIRTSYSRGTSYIFVKLLGLEYGGTYRFSITSNTIFDLDGADIPAISKTWTMHRSKADSVIKGMIKMYDTNIGSTLRGLVEAICISDETIGGDF